MNILINCPSSLKNNSKLDNKLGGIESLTLALAKKLSETSKSKMSINGCDLFLSKINQLINQ